VLRILIRVTTILLIVATTTGVLLWGHAVAVSLLIITVVAVGVGLLFDPFDTRRPDPSGDEPTSYWGGWGRPGM